MVKNKSNFIYIALLIIIMAILSYFMVVKPLMYRKIFNIDKSAVNSINYNGVEIKDPKFTNEATDILNSLEGKSLDLKKAPNLSKKIENFFGLENKEDTIFLELEDNSLTVYKVTSADLKDNVIDDPKAEFYFLKDNQRILKLLNSLTVLTDKFKKSN